MNDGRKEGQIELLLEQREWLRALARRLVTDSAAAEDLVQETWLVALRTPPDTSMPVRPWLAGVVRRLALMRRRGDGRRARRDRVAAHDEALPSTAELLERMDLQRRLAERVTALDEPLRTTVLLRYHEGVSAAEIARRQGIPAGTVRWRLKRGLDVLRSELDVEHGGRERWMPSFIAFARVEPAWSASSGVALGGSALHWMVAACVLLGVALTGLLVGPLACHGGQGARPTALDGKSALASGGDESAVERGVSTFVEREALGPNTGPPRRSSSSAASGDRSLSIVLVDERGAPLIEAELLAYDAEGVPAGHSDGAIQRWSADRSGRVTLEALSPKATLFLAERGAFLRRLPAGCVDPRAPAGEVQTLVVPEGGVVSGRLEGLAGSSASGLLLELDSDHNRFDAAPLPVAVIDAVGLGRRARAVTQPDGSFRFHGLPARWSGTLWLPRTHRTEGEARGAFGDESVHLDSERADLLLRVAERPILVGRVVDGHGGVYPNARLRVYVPDSTTPAEAQADLQGQFRLALPALPRRELVLEIDVGGVAPTIVRASWPTAGAIGDLVVPAGLVPRTRALEIQVLDRHGVPAPGLWAHLRADGSLFPFGGRRTTPARPAQQSLEEAVFALSDGALLALDGLTCGSPLYLTIEDASGHCVHAETLEADTLCATVVRHIELQVELMEFELQVVDGRGRAIPRVAVHCARAGGRRATRGTDLAGKVNATLAREGPAPLELHIARRGFSARTISFAKLDPSPELRVVELEPACDVTVVLRAAASPRHGGGRDNADPGSAAETVVELDWGSGVRLRANEVSARGHHFQDVAPGPVDVVISRGDVVQRERRTLGAEPEVAITLLEGLGPR